MSIEGDVYTIQNGETVKRDYKIFTTSTGRRIRIKPVNPMLLSLAKQKAPKPTPPMQDNGQGQLVPNYGHPDYEVALQEYEAAGIELQFKLTYMLGIDETIDKEAVKQLRDVAEACDGTLDSNDMMVFVQGVLLEGDTDTIKLYQAILGQSQPTQEKVDAAKDAFRGDVQG